METFFVYVLVAHYLLSGAPTIDDTSQGNVTFVSILGGEGGFRLKREVNTSNLSLHEKPEFN